MVFWVTEVEQESILQVRRRFSMLGQRLGLGEEVREKDRRRQQGRQRRTGTVLENLPILL